MKRLLIFLAVCLMVMRCIASQVLWVGIDGVAKIHKGNMAYGWEDFAAAIGRDAGDIAAKITVNGEPMPAGYEDPSGYIPAGQVAPTILFDSPEWGITFEFGVWMVDNDWNAIPGSYADWQPIRLDITDKNASVIFEIGYWTEDDFIPVAYSDPVLLGSIWNDHSYTSEDLNPPTQTPWRPLDFYMPVPEPSIEIFLAFGLAALIASRKIV